MDSSSDDALQNWTTYVADFDDDEVKEIGASTFTWHIDLHIKEWSATIHQDAAEQSTFVKLALCLGTVNVHAFIWQSPGNSRSIQLVQPMSFSYIATYMHEIGGPNNDPNFIETVVIGGSVG